MTDENIYNLLQTLYKYYPIGTKTIYNEYYPGFKELERIGQEKFEKVCKQSLEPWMSFLNEISSISIYELVDCTSTTHPYLAAYLLLNKRKDENEEKILYFHIQLSLLGPIYTTFYTLQNRAYEKNQIIHLGYKLYKSNSFLLARESNIDFNIDEIINKYYSDYQYFQHDFLINFYINDATPYTTPNNVYLKENMTPIYDYFFNKSYRQDAIILN